MPSQCRDSAAGVQILLSGLMLNRQPRGNITMKYLIFEDFSGQPVPFIFPDRVDHSDMRDQMPYGKVLSAGYVEFSGGSFHCHGGSQELGIVARQAEDTAVLVQALQPEK